MRGNVGHGRIGLLGACAVVVCAAASCNPGGGGGGGTTTTTAAPTTTTTIAPTTTTSTSTSTTSTSTSTTTTTTVPAPPPGWALTGSLSFGGPTFVDGVQVHDVTRASNGDAIVAGSFTGTVSFETTNETSAGVNDGFIARVSPSTHTFQWVKTFGGSGDDNAWGVTVDGNTAYLTGNFIGNITVGSTVLANAGADHDVIVASFAADTGAVQWATRAGGTYDDVPTDIAERNGTIAVSGRIGRSTSSGDALLLVLGTDGHVNAQHAWTGATTSSTYGVTIDANNLVTAVGSYTGQFTIGSTHLASNGDEDIFVAQLSTSGTFHFAKSYGGAGADRGVAIASAPNGDLALTGWFAGTVNFAGTNLVAQGPYDIFVLRLSSAGAGLAARRFGGPTYAEVSTAIAVDSGGNVVITGTTIDTIDFGPGVAPLPGLGSQDPFVADLTSDLSHARWARRLTDPNGIYDYGSAVAASATDGSVIAAGIFCNTLDLGNGTVLHNGNGRTRDSYEGYVAAYS